MPTRLSSIRQRSSQPLCLAFWLILSLASSTSLAGRAESQTPQKPAPAKKPPTTATPAAPSAPVSKHYPILLIAAGTAPSWSVRIGMKGAERLERAAYPPVPLDPGAIEQDGANQAWLYHAKDSATAADVTVRLSREACTDGVSDTKYSFRAIVTHAQIGELRGCAKIAPDQFPEFKQKNLEDDDPDKKKPAPPPITNFKPPVAVAYLDPAGKVMLARGEVAKLVAPKGSQLSLSHDGKRLLFIREDRPTDRAIVLYDSATGKTTELFRGPVQSAYWSPDDTRIAFLKFADGNWRIWATSISATDNAAQLSSNDVLTLDGWADPHTVLASNSAQLMWIGEDGQTKQTISTADLYGNVFAFSSANSFRMSPVNPDLLLVSAEMSNPPAGVPVDPHLGGSIGLFLYEIRSKRRVLLNPPKMFAQYAEWSRDGLQIFFTAWDASRNTAIYREFWDGSGFKRVRPGSNLVIGQ